MKQLLVNFLFLSAVSGMAQNFSHSLSIASAHDGLQALALSPELKSISAGNLSDVRLYDKNNREVPYFMVNESFEYRGKGFKEYEVVDKEVGKGRYTSFTVHNPKKEKIQNIVLCVNNSDAWKICNIVGSDDRKQWFSISDHIFLYNLYDLDKVYAYRTLQFPLVDYKYIKVEINDLVTKPLNILKAGYFEGSICAGKLNDLDSVTQTYKTNDVKKISRLDVRFRYPTQVDKITFEVKAPRLYKRRAVVCVDRTRTVKNLEETYKAELMSFELNSETANSFNLTNLREMNFYIEIYNGDNPPLEFEKISLSQLQSYLVADFRKDEKYILMAGNKKLGMPEYDIENFRSKISQYLPTLMVGKLKAMPAAMAPIIAREVPFWQQAWFLWSCIALASFMLLLFSLRVLKDISRGNREQ